MLDLGKFISRPSELDLLFLLLGGVMGIFYGFDGWRGTEKDVEFRKSRRVRNFLWVVGAGFLTFVADLKTLDASANKERVLLAYLLGFLIFGAFVVLGGGFLIAAKFSLMRLREHGAHTRGPFSPFLDYIQYGYQYHRKQYEESLSQKTEQDGQNVEIFLLAYVKKLIYAMAAVNSFRLSPESKRDVAVQILNYICAVVVEHGKLPGAEVNANYMLAYHRSVFTEDLRSRLRFAFGNTDRYEFYLALEEYAEDRGRENFVLPVEPKNGDGTMALPGAPLAFLKNDTVVEDDVQKIKFAKRVPQSTAAEMREYFVAKSFRSFGSLNIVGRGKQLGIVNVESNLSHVFGRTQDEKKRVTALLHPFCLLLGEVVKPRKSGED
jgi:hypothetical protein